jgi:hypothetical protein
MWQLGSVGVQVRGVQTRDPGGVGVQATVHPGGVGVQATVRAAGCIQRLSAPDEATALVYFRNPITAPAVPAPIVGR